MAPDLTLNVLWVQEGNPDMHFLFLSKVSLNEPPPGSSTEPLWRELSVYRAFLNTSQIPHKNFPK